MKNHRLFVSFKPYHQSWADFKNSQKPFYKASQKNSTKYVQGFTLLEILVVMVIIGLLATIGLRSFSQSQMKARDSRRKSDIEQLSRALELYRGDKGHYPVHNEQGKMMVFWMDGGSSQDVTFEWGEPFIDPAQPSTVYMAKLPIPSGAYTLFYESYIRDTTEESGYRVADYTAPAPDREAQAYRIYTMIENSQDPAILGAMNVNCQSGTGTTYCNYAVSSSNLLLEYDFVESQDEDLQGGVPLGDDLEDQPPTATASATLAPTLTNTPVPTNTTAPTKTPTPSPTPVVYQEYDGDKCVCAAKDRPICPDSVICQDKEGGGCYWRCVTEGNQLQ